MKPIVIFGDVHGEAKQLAALIAKVRARFGQEVSLYSLGDLIDRGPDSQGVIDICIQEHVQGILGNHELWLHAVAQGEDIHPSIYTPIMGGASTVLSYGLTKGATGADLRKAMGPEHIQYIKNLPPYRYVHDGVHGIWLIHCGLSSDVTHRIQMSSPQRLNDAQLVEVALRASSDIFFWQSPKVKERRLHTFTNAIQVFGHLPQREALVVPNHFVALDTGCGTTAPHRLSAAIFRHDTDEIEIITSDFT